ncbi:peptide deformylase [Pseudogemmobacter sonorensis]|uniref:peptide deformylase n=1 Tax=Pseudogemmobacter sonorensis TaxID=2989681 RepID=UPI0036C64535
MAEQLAYPDPRIYMKPLAARLEDDDTRAALRLLSDVLAPRRDRVVAAPAYGLPVRVIASRRGDDVRYLLNPRLIEASDLVINVAETCPQTGPIRRSVLRARNVTMSGTGLRGEQFVLKLEGVQAFEAQMALDLMERPDPFDWLTAYHRHCLRVGESWFGVLNAGLYSARDGDILRFSGLNRVAFHPDGTEGALCSFDGLNPMLPIEKRHRKMLGLISVLTPLRHVYFNQAENLPVVVAALLISRGAKIYGPEAAIPVVLLERLGIAGAFHRHPLDGSGLAAGQAPLDVVLFDKVAAPDAPLPVEADLRQFARRLDGMTGTLLIAMPAQDPALEHLLQRVFPNVLAYPSPKGEVIYAARKTWEGEAQIRARMISGGATSGIDFVDTLSEPWIYLRKDGGRQLL